MFTIISCRHNCHPTQTGLNAHLFNRSSNPKSHSGPAPQQPERGATKSDPQRASSARPPPIFTPSTVITFLLLLLSLPPPSHLPRRLFLRISGDSAGTKSGRLVGLPEAACRDIKPASFSNTRQLPSPQGRPQWSHISHNMTTCDSKPATLSLIKCRISRS